MPAPDDAPSPSSSSASASGPADPAAASSSPPLTRIGYAVAPKPASPPAVGGTGLAYGLAAFGIWGGLPIYFRAIPAEVGVFEVLAHRICWSVPFLLVIVALTGRLAELRRLMLTWGRMRPLVVSAALIGGNWLAYLYGVVSGQVVETSLGYFLVPLVNVALGTLLLRERLRPAQVAGLALGTVGVLWLALQIGRPPWIALTCAASFGLYGLVRKFVPVDGLMGLTVETILLLPAAVGWVGWLTAAGLGHFVGGNPFIDAMLLCSGAVTCIPLMCFGQAATRLPLTTIGFLQYISPCLQFACAVLLFGEPVTTGKLVGFAFIWAALGVYTADAVYAASKAALVAPSADPSDPSRPPAVAGRS
jgi:chloramphenicol-sensitive protein RarD